MLLAISLKLARLLARLLYLLCGVSLVLLAGWLVPTMPIHGVIAATIGVYYAYDALTWKVAHDRR